MRTVIGLPAHRAVPGGSRHIRRLPRPRMRIRAVFVAGALLALLAPGASGQSVLVEVRAAESGAALTGVFVSLVDEEGRTHRSALTDEAGRALLRAERAGTFRVRGELIGRETGTSEPVALEAGTGGGVAGRAGGGAEAEAERVVLSLPSHAIPLSEITVEVGDRCRLRPEEATALARVWEEARKALEVQAWAEGEGAYRLRISTYARDLDETGRLVEREERQGNSLVTRVPFASLPPQELMGEGFVRRLDDGGYQYYGPDAAVLLSDAFLDTHCFRLTRSAEQPGSIGLAFEPVHAGVRADIRGTFWLDEATGALRRIEYGYTGAPYREAEGVAGGLVEFRALPNGAWLIERWRIRAPLLGRDQGLARGGDSGIRVIGIRETGGEVTRVATLDRRTVSRVARGVVEGVVWDSTAAAPLAGARVRLEGTPYETETDSAGRFVLEELPAGVFTVSFSHPRLEELGVVEPAGAADRAGAADAADAADAVDAANRAGEAELAGPGVPGVEAEVVPGATTELTLAIPSRETILVAACRTELAGGTLEGRPEAPGASAEGAGPGAVLSGVVRTRSGGAPVPGARVRVEWQEVERVEPMAQARDRWLEVGADEGGRYTVCGMPVDEEVRVQARFLNERTETTEVAFAEEEHRVLDLALDLRPEVLATGAAGAAGDPGGEGAGSGLQGVQGRLLEHESERPVRTAEVTLRSGTGEVLATGTTNEQGFFRLQVPRPGRFLLSTRALGYAAVEDHAVDVPPERLTVLDVRVATEAFDLEPIVVTAEARSFHLEMEGFYRRRDQGLGVHMPPDLLEERRPQKATDLFFGLSGIRVVEQSLGAGGRGVYFRGGERPGADGIRICWPMVYVDRHLVSTGGDMALGVEPTAVDDLVAAHDILAIEAFRTPAELPAEFNGPNAGCGVIVLWTRRGGGG